MKRQRLRRGEFAASRPRRIRVLRPLENLLASHRGEVRPKAAEVPRAVANATINCALVHAAENLPEDPSGGELEHKF